MGEVEAGVRTSVFLDISRLQVERLSPVPLYFQIERLIEQEILTGRSAPGSRLPAEPELAGHFTVSRSVVRQALTRLEHAGLIARVRGHGTFVCEQRQRSWLVQGTAGFFKDEVERLGHRVTSRVLHAGVERLPSWASDALELPRDSDGVLLERVRAVDGTPMVYDLNYLPVEYTEAVLSLAENPEGSLYKVLLERHHVSVVDGYRQVDAVITGTRFAEILETDAASPLLVIDGVDLDADLRPFDCYRTWLRPDRLKLEVRVVAGGSFARSGGRPETA
jgi:DNA-binding GntR family transcriptional regulator